jgi:hypothetical protein
MEAFAGSSWAVDGSRPLIGSFWMENLAVLNEGWTLSKIESSLRGDVLVVLAWSFRRVLVSGTTVASPLSQEPSLTAEEPHECS